ncbi:RidA family protein [Zavarzinia compransoris]|uniref:RidA family protein n=1 Tax=Zavarzinia marina TaxID=2911065 RepID=UPI001F3D3C63|nr:RidA family protein [Zavarzinia marina]MCF4165545.1 RidA family protein [Zavarzinia marina]
MAIVRFDSGPRMSQAVVFGQMIFLAGQVAETKAGHSVTEQTTEILGQIDALLARAGSDKDHILSATIYLTDISTFEEMNLVWESWVTPDLTPARATVEAKLAAPQYTVEIQVTAARK